MTLDQHLSHLTWLMAEPFTDAWKTYCWHRAKELAKRPEFAELPRLLTAAIQSSAPTPCAESKPKPRTPLATTASP
jgi:hypothetical protein